jgi:hypothetical protein
MTRVILIKLVILFAAPVAFAQTDAGIINTIQTNAISVFLEQAHWVLPESFHNSELPPSDKERIIQQLANDTANCMADAAVEYAALNGVPLSDFVSSEGIIHFDGDSGEEFRQSYYPCVSRAWDAAGISQEQ